MTDLDQQVAALRSELRALRDRVEIRDCMDRYARGLDRHDEAMLASAYHPDALEVHGEHYIGPIPAFVQWVNDLHAKAYAAHQHHITQHRADIDGDVAHAETYVLHVLRRHEGNVVDIGGSRYIDRLERREGVWKIALRHVRVEWYGHLDGSAYDGVSKLYPAGNQDPTDISYDRPLLPPVDMGDMRAESPPPIAPIL